MIPVSGAFAANQATRHGAEGAAWVGRIPATLAAVEAEWGCSATEFLEGSRVSAVFAVRTAVLKLQPPDFAALPVPDWAGRAEVAALRVWDGHGAARLLAADPNHRALLIERGTNRMLSGSAELDAMASCFGELHRRLTIPDGVPGIAKLVEFRLAAAARLVAPDPPPDWRQHVEHARRLSRNLLATTKNPALLHGDPMPRNFVSRGRTVIAIDPAACAGDPAFDVAFWCLTRNFGEVDVRRRMDGVDERIRGLSARLGLDAKRVAAWSDFISETSYPRVDRAFAAELGRCVAGHRQDELGR